MKWAVLALAIAAIVPLGDRLRRNARAIPIFCTILGFLPFGVGAFHLYMATISWPLWPGYVKGVEISLLDLMAVALFISLPHRRFTLPFCFSMALYFFGVLASAFQTPVPMASLFYTWQLARVFLVYAVVTKACAVDDRVAPALLAGMSIGLCFEAGEAIWERFVLGVFQASGSLGHQNFLGLMSEFVFFPVLALLLAGERKWVLLMSSLAGVVIAVLTVSRAAIGLLCVGSLLLFALSALRGWNGRKALIFFTAIVVAVLVAPFILSSIADRFTGVPSAENNYDERAAFEQAAGMMLSDHPMGVGANYYVVAANVEGYNAKAGVISVIGSDSANVHNVYFLVAAETGYIGLVAFVLVLLQPLTVAFRCGLLHRRDRRGDLLVGLGVSLLIIYVHSFFEWVFISFSAQYMFALVAGMVAGLAQQLGYWHAAIRPMSASSLNSIVDRKKVEVKD